jgi:hypothetical protein
MLNLVVSKETARLEKIKDDDAVSTDAANVGIQCSDATQFFAMNSSVISFI